MVGSTRRPVIPGLALPSCKLNVRAHTGFSSPRFCKFCRNFGLVAMIFRYVSRETLTETLSMRPLRSHSVCVVVAYVLSFASPARAQSHPYPTTDVRSLYTRLLAQIEKIAIFDHHAHPGFPDDPDVDAMAAPPGSSPLRERDTNPELVAAAKALFKYPYADLSAEHAKWLVNRKAELKKEKGIAYFSDILDLLNIEQGVANRAMMADYLDPKRFVWVFFADSFMWPFDNQKERSRNVDEQVYIPLQEKMLHRWMEQEKLARLPAAFSDYLTFISRTLDDNQRKGAIA